MIRTLTIGIGVALAATTVLAITLERATRPPAKPPPKEATRSVAALPTPIEPKVIKTETFARPKVAPVLVAPPAKPALLDEPKRALDEPSTRPPLRTTIVPDDPKPPQAAPPKPSRDICSRHNMRKVYTRNGRSWRCRR